MKLPFERTACFALGVMLTVAATAPAIAGPAARVCTRDTNGYVNIRAVIGTDGRITGRAYNGQTIPLSGWYGTPYQGFTWYQTSGGGWVRGDYLCAPQPQYGPGNFSF